MKDLRGLLSEFRSGKGLKGQLLRGGVGSLAVKIVSTGINLLLAIVLARRLGAEGFGIYSFAIALTTILAIPAQMGLPQLVVRETAKAQVVDNWGLIKGLWHWATSMAVMMSVGLILVSILVTGAFSGFFSHSQLSAFAWALPLIPLIALGNLRGAALRGLRRITQGLLPEFIFRPLFFTILLLAFAGIGPDLDAVGAMMLHVCAALAAFLIGAILLYRAVPSQFNTQPKILSDKSAWLASALPLALFAGVQVINMNIGLVGTGLLSSDEDVAFLRIALQGATLVSFGLAAANMVISPYIARMLEEKDNDRVQRLLTVSARIVLAISVPILLLFIVWGEGIIFLIFGSEFSRAYPALAVLAIGQFWNALMSSNDVLLNMAGRERVALRGVAFGTIANFVLCALLIPFYGALGGAIAYSASLVIWNTYLWVRARQLLGFDTSAIGWTASVSVAR